MNIARVIASKQIDYVTFLNWQELQTVLVQYQKMINPQIQYHYIAESDFTDSLFEESAPIPLTQQLSEFLTTVYSALHAEGFWIHTDQSHSIIIRKEKDFDIYHLSITDDYYDEVIAEKYKRQQTVNSYLVSLPLHLCNEFHVTVDFATITGRIGRAISGEKRINPDQLVKDLVKSYSSGGLESTPSAIIHQESDLLISLRIPNQGACGGNHTANSQTKFQESYNQYKGRGSTITIRFHHCSKKFQREDGTIQLAIYRTPESNEEPLPIWEKEQKKIARQWQQNLINALREP